MRIKRWKEMSEREVVELKRNQCMKCVYLSKSSPSSISNATVIIFLLLVIQEAVRLRNAYRKEF